MAAAEGAVTVSELVRKYKALRRECLARQRAKSERVLAANFAALEAHTAIRLQELRDRQGQGQGQAVVIPRFGTGIGSDAPTAAPGQPLGPGHGLATGLVPLPLVALGKPKGRGRKDWDGKAGVRMERAAAAAAGEGGKAAGEGGKAAAGGSAAGAAATTSQRLFPRAIPSVQQLPAYDSWTYLKRNELAQDHGRRMFLVDELGETVPADTGEADEGFPWEEADGRAVDWAMAALGREHGWDSEEVIEALIEVLKLQQQPEVVAQRLAYLQRTSVRVTDQDRTQCELGDMMNAFLGSFCRRCRTYGCRTHGGSHQAPHQRPAPPPPDALGPGPCGPHCWKLAAAGGQGAAGGAGATGAAEGAGAGGEEGGDGDAMEVDGQGEQGLGQGQERQGEGSDGGAGGSGSGGGGAGSDWTPFELSTVRWGIKVYGAGNPCMVATLVGPPRTCAQVKTQLDAAVREAAGGAAGQGEAGAGQGEAAAGAGGDGGAEDGGNGNAALARVPARRKGRGKRPLLSSRPGGSLVVLGRKAHGPNDPWQEYSPCACVGRCREDCPCVAAKNFCEKFCACAADCRERFPGCNCRAGCTRNSCPCVAAGRECDPDICGGCAPTLEGTAAPDRQCHNMRLRTGQHAHVVLGTSDIPDGGWGVFAAQHVPRNGFLGEYTGDLITQDEANRRGAVYDHNNSSYLFNLNTEWVVDAKYRGNKLRCANHSLEPTAKAKVMVVDGESRIGIFAERAIQPGMEITYNYGYSEDVAPPWTKNKTRGGR